MPEVSEEKLKESEEQFRLIVENLKDYAIILLDTNGNIVSWNNSAERIEGYKATEITGKNISVFYTDDEIKRHEPELNLKATKEYGRLERQGWRVRKDGSLFFSDIILTALYDDKNNFKGYAKIIRDITERKKAEDVIYKSEQKFRAFLEFAPDALVIVDNKGIIMLINAQTEKLFGYNRTELYGNTIETLIPERFREKHVAHRIGYYKEPKVREMGAGLELYGRKKNGTEFPVEISLNFLNTEGGIVVSAAIRDITGRKKAEEKIHQLNIDLTQKVHELEISNKEMESFSYSIAHDLRAPIRAINGFSAIVIKKYSSQFDKEGKGFLNIISSESVRMGQLIDDLLSFSRLGKKEIQKSKVDMMVLAKEVVDEILKLSEKKYTAKINVALLPAADCDSSLIRQVFLNLISNALKFSSTKPEPVIEIGSSEEKDSRVYFVKDNGAGFDMKYVDKLFNVFQRLHNSEEFAGTGIGLAIVKRIIVRHGGRVWAEGKVNEGATFYFTLPKISAKTI